MKAFNSKFEIVFCICIVLFLSIWGTRAWLISSKVDKDGVYVICRITELSRAKNGLNVKGWYIYNGRKFFVNGKPGLLYPTYVGKGFFIKISKEDPSLINFVKDREVPECLDVDSKMILTWNTIPTCD